MDLNELRLQNIDPEIKSLADMIAEAQSCVESGELTKEEFKEILEDIHNTKLITDKSKKTVLTNQMILVVETLISLY